MLDTTKRLLVLGGSHYQVPFIEKAKERGLHVITCDYLPDNPGHVLAHEYHNVSTTDKAAVLALAKKLRIDAIATFASDPAIATVAYVAEKLGLPGPSLSSIEKLTEKDKFRMLMKKAGLNTPVYHCTTSPEVPDFLTTSTSSYVVKPVDSSGSKGITRSSGTFDGLLYSIQYALKHSRAGRCVIEEFIDGEQIHGDGFLHKGKLINHYLGDHHFYTKTNSFIPISTRWPSRFNSAIIADIVNQVEIIAKESGYLDGPVNIEARVNSQNEVYIIEVGPRNGGNFVPIIQQRLTGFDFIEAVLANALAEEISYTNLTLKKPGAHYILHAEAEGVFREVIKSSDISEKIFFEKIFKNPGEMVAKFTGSNATVGVYLLEFESIIERDKIMTSACKDITVIVD